MKITEFCTKCGNQLADHADFCHKCGSKIVMVKGVPTAVSIETKTPSHTVEEHDSMKYAKRRNVVIGLSVGLIAIIIVPIIIWGVFGFINYTHIGSYTYDETSMEYTNLNLVIDNNVGSIDVYYEDSLTKPFEAIVELYGRKGASLLDAVNFTTTYLTNDTMEINFNSGDFDFFFWDKKVFTYDMSIYINPLVTADVFIDADTGSVSFSTEGLDSIIIENLDISSNTGSIDLDLINSVNTTFNGLNLKGNTGRISVDLGSRTTINDSYVLIDTDTGSIDFEFVDLIAYDDQTWEITTDTGSIDVSITQNIVLPFTFMSHFDIDTDTGSISVDFLFNDTIGYSFYGTTSTGSVDILGSEDEYISPNYGIATNLYVFELSTSTGSVTVTEK
ncbi:MAG: zinc ribbon domain-containing protein [Candidatus Heimdallarchaeota archaeon]|nr:zinc ribbon domain-containing protein [Candidatus Heimdallarchaeota archaeon]